ncbi:hypothetical protein PSYCIT7_013830 [Pseudomonas syringae Cit 7]|uniref:Uncharacterized protein n=1 Tax=Pseudomonas syringae Cit 7 TaxID=629264 RepID=A0A8T8LRI6_PSESX|nr:abortive infection system antitoxin AbiGi family protein [Pseudomonas syringae]PBP64980.1 hypothetical protein CCL19_16295 [Pseudomonas syringae]QUP63917.1 hypothetical protein PSYCIT7_013830 [Pseudomonas syringae Cit 7]SDS63783.1 Putative abortive phage resistance protein AbiGi, antitoxin [Pseudomonas syringae]
MQPKSNTLFHFTRNIENLKLILSSGFWPRYCLEDVSWIGYDEFNYVAYPMVCFCEAPLSRISEHVGFYGSFGLGLTRQWAEKNGLNPVFYTSPGSGMAQSFKRLNELANKAAKPLNGEIKDLMREYLSFAKPTVGTMLLDGEPVQKLFYQESEWRYVAHHPDVEKYLVQGSFNKEETRIACNQASFDNCLLKFAPGDIRYIFVRDDSDIPNIIKFIQDELDYHPAADLKVLTSRVTSLESIHLDL